jgi:molybdopterin-binding protein
MLDAQKDGIHVHGNVACSISTAGQLAVSAITSPITAQSVTDMNVTAGNVLVSQAKSDNMKIRATNCLNRF